LVSVKNQNKREICDKPSFLIFPVNQPFPVKSSGNPVQLKGNQKNKIGRKGTYLTASELKEIVQQYYFSKNPDEKQRVLQKYGSRKVRHGLAICKLDIGKNGAISRRTCSFHGNKYLVYNHLEVRTEFACGALPQGDVL